MAIKVLVFESDPAFAETLRTGLLKYGCEVSVVDDANNLYNRWLLTHPIEALGDFFRRPVMVWNSAGGSWVFYRNPEFKEFKLVDLDVLLFPPLGVVAVIGAAAAALLVSTRPIT